MDAKDFIRAHNEVVFWNIFRYNEDTCEWDSIDLAEVEDCEVVDEAFFDKAYTENDTCDLYLA